MVQSCVWNYIHINIYFPGGAGAPFCSFSAGAPTKDGDFGSSGPWWVLLISDSETPALQATDQTQAEPNASGYSSIWLC